MAVNNYFCVLDNAEVVDNKPRWDDINQAEMEQLVEEVNAVAENVKEMNVSVEYAVKTLRHAADDLDQVWKDCKVASAVGSGTNILGGLLVVGGGVATVMTAGFATPLMVAGTAFGVAGSCTNLGSSFIEASANFSLIQTADVAVENANRAINNVKDKIRLLKNGNSQLRLVFLAHLASRMLGSNHLAVALIKGLLRPDLLAQTLCTSAARAVHQLALRVGVVEVTTAAFRGIAENGSKEALNIGAAVGARKAAEKVGTEAAVTAVSKAGSKAASKAAGKIAVKDGSRAIGKAGSKAASKAGNIAVRKGSKAVGKAATKQGAKAGAKAAGGFIIGVSAAFLVFDAIELTFTVRDIVNNKGSDAARCLRYKADEMEVILHA